MHEMSIAQSIIDIALEEAEKANADLIKTIAVDVGALSCVDPHALDFGFKAVAAGTRAEQARLQIETVPASAYCFACEATVEVKHRGAACPSCGSRKLIVTQGEDLRVRELEIV